MNVLENAVEAIANQKEATQADLKENHPSKRNFKWIILENQIGDLLNVTRWLNLIKTIQNVKIIYSLVNSEKK